MTDTSHPSPADVGASPMRVAVIGAGPSGLAAARAFLRLGMTVTVYEGRADIGGVWSASRRYPGIATQNGADSYSFSDARMSSARRVPTGAEVRAYLQEFARATGVAEVVQLATVVRNARPRGGGWAFDVVAVDGVRSEEADWFVVANGLYSKPFVPEYTGRDGFEAHGGAVLAPSELGEAEALLGKDVVVVGWGKSAADVAVAAARVARTVTVVVRRVGWKLPTRFGTLSWERIVLSRLGEFLLWGPYRSVVGRIARRATDLPRRAAVALLIRRITAMQRLIPLGLLPDARRADFDHVMTEGLLDAVESGRIEVRAGRTIVSLGDDSTVSLDDGTRLRADVLVAATGFDVDLDLFAPGARDALLDDSGALGLVRHMLPRTLPHLGFIGWTGSFRSPLSAEIQAAWLGAVMSGAMRVPTAAWRTPRLYRPDRARAAALRLPRTPETASYAVLDSWLHDLGLSIAWWRRRREFFGPVDPSAYAGVLPRLVARVGAERARGSARPPGLESPGSKSAARESAHSGADPVTLIQGRARKATRRNRTLPNR